MCDIHNKDSKCNYKCNYNVPTENKNGGDLNLCGCPKDADHGWEDGYTQAMLSPGGDCSWSPLKISPSEVCEAHTAFNIPLAFCGDTDAHVPPFVPVTPTPIPRDATLPPKMKLCPPRTLPPAAPPWQHAVVHQELGDGWRELSVLTRHAQGVPIAKIRRNVVSPWRT